MVEPTTHTRTHLEEVSVPVVVRVLGVRGEAVGYRHAVRDAFQSVRSPAPLVRGDLVVEDRQIVRANFFRLGTLTWSTWLFSKQGGPHNRKGAENARLRHA